MKRIFMKFVKVKQRKWREKSMLKSRVEVVKIDDYTDDQVEKVVYVIHE